MQMKYLRNEKGMALVMSLILAVITLAFSAALIFMITQGTKMSGLEKIYATALDAGKGGIAVITEVIDDGGDIGMAGVTISNPKCLNEKLFKKTAYWNLDLDDPAHPPLGDEVEYCAISGAAMSEDASVSPDIDLIIGSGQNTYHAYLKITETIDGNSSPVKSGIVGSDGTKISSSGGEITVSAVVEGGAASSSTIVPMHVPFLYKIEVLTERIDPDTGNARAGEAKALLSLLYAH